jgi:hypothetical protein
VLVEGHRRVGALVRVVADCVPKACPKAIAGGADELLRLVPLLGNGPVSSACRFLLKLVCPARRSRVKMA